MATRIPTAAADAKSTTMVPICSCHLRSKVSFALSTKPNIQFLSKASLGLRRAVTVKAIENKEQDESISEFISQVRNLVKLVDSSDIAELSLKQLDCELLIRKKDAIAPPTSPVAPVSSGVSQQVATPAPSPSQAPPPPKPAAKSSSHPPLKSPMAGTFYRSPAPGAPPFVKVGDRVQKGQPVCIVEAMKLMNEIEADQSGIITEILAEDAKPVSVDTPLLVIHP